MEGDIPAILAVLSADVEWHEPPSGPFPFCGTRRGRDAVGAFFQSLTEVMDMTSFAPHDFVAAGNRVIAFGSYAGRGRATNRELTTDWSMVWTFKDEHISHFQIYKDSAAELMALGEPAINERNIAIVKRLYSLFGSGDVAGILDHLRADVAWDSDAADRGVPWIKPRHGRKEVAEFFASLEALEFRTFEPLDFLAGNGKVASTVRFEARVKATGQMLSEIELHLFAFDEGGRVRSMKHYVDTFRHVQASHA
ncbi:MAG: nuclear transport factor 2 family protein [Candidatus Schekmanbacteria bacterium]|nr:nuclear transport factor 2 family protein [Candidatus Schekmanbacteria bacterium]